MKMTRDAAIKHLLVASDCSECAAIVTMLMRSTKRQDDALALLRELNDALLPIPDDLQARLDAVLDRAEEKR